MSGSGRGEEMPDGEILIMQWKNGRKSPRERWKMSVSTVSKMTTLTG